ncbi:MAG TPA: hypothetical protein VLF59_03440 [Candidatus Saccharimonadales bacterium]|nr:hypothetical protein [Candidatus Saccharimonadales bacterium]
MFISERHTSPLTVPLRQAEQAITDIVAAPSAEWGIDAQDWVVGVNTAASTEARDNPDVLVSQALSPKPAEHSPLYTARTPYGALRWREGARDLKDLRHPDNRRWTDLTQAKKALGAMSSATVVQPSNPSRPQ